MSPIVSPDSPADVILDRAADIIEANGRHIGNYWPPDLTLDTDYGLTLDTDYGWSRGKPCCVVGAVGIALGVNNAWDVEGLVVPAVRPESDGEPPHPAFAALMAHLGFDCVNHVFRWSDEHEADEIARVMRDCAADLRARAGVPA